MIFYYIYIINWRRQKISFCFPSYLPYIQQCFLILWFLPQKWPFHSLVYWPPFSITMVQSVVDKPSVNLTLAKCWYPTTDPHSSKSASLGMVSDLVMGIIGNWAISSAWEGTVPFDITSWLWRNSDRYQFQCKTLPSTTKPAKDLWMDTIHYYMGHPYDHRVIGNDWVHISLSLIKCADLFLKYRIFIPCVWKLL